MVQARRDDRPWYKQFWPWFLIALPASSVVAGLYTLHLAIVTKDGLVVDDYYKAGLAINRTLDRDRRARALGIAAVLRYMPRTGQLTLYLEGGKEGHLPEQLKVRLVHPTREGFDRQLVLKRTDARTYTGTVRLDARGNWHILVTPPDRSWRIGGRTRLETPVQIRLAPFSE